MSKFKIIKGVDSALKGSGKILVDIEFLGIGGAFDIEEGMSSALLKTRGGKLLLIDCGYTSYAKIKNRGLVDKIDKVFITHTHEDHFSGISSLIYDRFFLHNLVTHIECTPEVAVLVKKYLEVTNHMENQYTISIDNVFIEDEAISITKIDTTAHHWPGGEFPNSGLLFHFDTGDDHAVLIYSGDINISILDLMPEETYPFVYDNPDNVFIFHDMTHLVHDMNPHANFELLIPILEKFENLFTYHHGEGAVGEINKLSPEMAATSLIIQGEDFVIEESRGL